MLQARVLGPLLGLFLIFTPLPLLLVNLIGSVVFAIAIPFTTTGTTLLYFDLLARQEQHGVLPRRSWAFWHPATFGRQIEQPAA